jgi:hypothetical protein
VQPAHISPKQLLALAQEANLGLDKVIEVFRIAAQPAPVQEPVATVKAKRDGGGTFVHWTKLPVAGMKLYTTSPAAQRQWVGLTDDDIEQEFGFIDELLRDCVYRTEAKVREKNT